MFDTLVQSYNPLNEDKESDDDSTSKDSTVSQKVVLFKFFKTQVLILEYLFPGVFYRSNARLQR